MNVRGQLGALVLLGACLTGATSVFAISWQVVRTGDDGRSQEVDLDSVRRWGVGLRYFIRTTSRDGTGGVIIEMFATCAGRTRNSWSAEVRPTTRVLPGTVGYDEVELVCNRAVEKGLISRAEVPTLPSQPQAAPAPERLRSTGSGFIVGPQVVVTNYHVIDGCKALKVRRDADVFGAAVLASSERSDLVALKLESSMGIPVAVRSSALLGEDVVVAGHPLAGVLSSDLIVTSGQVNSLAGLGNDPTMLQISAPVQQGNSGGPLIDRSGSVVGVVVSKLNVVRLAKLTGDLAQNVNFSIKPEVLRLFLDANRIPYLTAGLGKRLESFEIAERARAFTVQVICD